MFTHFDCHIGLIEALSFHWAFWCMILILTNRVFIYFFNYYEQLDFIFVIFALSQLQVRTDLQF
jgi:hypothetical protein